MASHHRFIFLIILKNKLQQENAKTYIASMGRSLGTTFNKKKSWNMLYNFI